MRAIRLILREWCQHQHREFEFGPGLTALIGPNGSGKSNVLAGMKFALTGQNILAGKLSANVNQLADDASASGVEFTFEHVGRVVTIKRWLRPEARQSLMTISGEASEIRGDRKINDAVKALLGVDDHILNEITIVNQNDIFGFLSQKHAERAAAFSKLFETEVAGAAWEACGRHLSSLQIPQNVVDLAAEQANLQQLQQRQGEVAALINGENSTAINSQWLEASNRHRRFISRSEAAMRRNELQHSRVAANTSLAAANDDIADIEGKIAVIQHSAEMIKEEATQAIQSLGAWTAIQEMEASRKEVLAQIEALENTQWQSPAAPADYKLSAELHDDLHALLVERAHLKHFLESLVDGVAECPTCGTPRDTLEAKLVEARERAPQVTALLDQLHARIGASRKYEEATAAFDEDRRRHAQQLQSLRAHLRTLSQSPAAPTKSKGELEGIVAEHRDYMAGIAEFTTMLRKAEQRKAAAEGQLEMLDGQIAECDATLAAEQISVAEAERLPAEIARLQERLVQLTRLEQEWGQLTTAVTETNARIGRATRLLHEAERKRSWAAKVQRLRDLLHRDAAPRFVSQRNMSRLQHSTNQYLAMFDTDYRVQAVEGFSFEAFFTDRRQQMAERLSWGQKVVLALSFRLAVNFMYADLDFLALDEPTAYLDEHHIRGFEPVLLRLREFTASRGFQCILITHETSLAPLFDAVIEL